MTQQEHIPVFYEGQDDLIDVLATSMASVCYNTSSFIDFYILDCGICKFNKKLLETMKEKFNNFSIEFIPVDLKQFEGLKGYTSKNFTDCYSRLLIPEIKKDITKAIYMDTDTIALDDISKLWNIDLQGKSIAVARDLGLCEVAWKNFVKNLNGDKNHPYLTAGVYLLNCEKWRQNSTTQNLLDLAKKCGKHLLVIIEELFSLYFDDDYVLLPCRFGFIDANDLYSNKKSLCNVTGEYLRRELKNIVVFHFAGGSKPWKGYKTLILNRKTAHFEDFWYYASLTPFFYSLQAKLDENILLSNRGRIQ